MGYSLSWLAVRGKDAATVRNALGLRDTGEREEIPDSPLLGADLPGGWYLVFANRCDFADSAPLAKLSSAADVVTCSVEEHVMYSSAASWNNGRQVWSVIHDAQQGAGHLDAVGELPPGFGPIRDRLWEEQAARGDADYLFDIPVELAKALIGFRHDQDTPGTPPAPFTRLASAKKWWQIWK